MVIIISDYTCHRSGTNKESQHGATNRELLAFVVDMNSNF